LQYILPYLYLHFTLKKKKGNIKMTLEKSLKIATAAATKATELGMSATITIVDRSGRVSLVHKGDGTGFLTTDTSRAKAMASAAFGKSTKELVELQKNNPAFWQALPSVVPGILPTTGACPIFENGQLIGAIGIGGGSPDQDHACALAGSNAI
jgi:uncharacterized protein GlcG (DUF336 family)